MTILFAIIIYLLIGYLVGQLLGFNGVVDIIIFPIVAVYKIINKDND